MAHPGNIVRTRAVRTAVLAVAMALTISPTVGYADTKTRSDPDDSPGSLDIASVSHAHGVRGLLVHTVKTFGPWENDLLEEPSTDFSLSIRFGDRYRRYRWIVIDVAEDGTLYGVINHPRRDEILGFAHVWRISKSGFKVAFAKRDISRHLDSYKWQVASSFHDSSSSECGSDGGHSITCIDVAPDSGFVRHNRNR